MLLYVAIIVGFVLSFLFPYADISKINGYETFLYALLGIGLYGSVYGIELAEFHKHKILILRAVTLGVVFKSFFIGGIFWLFFHTPYAFLLGIVVAQIDPLAVAHLIDKKSSKFSGGGRTILRAWSSFDDPMTVILALYIFLPFSVTAYQAFGLESYVMQIGANLAFAYLVYLLTKIVNKSNALALMLLGIAIIIAITFKLMLGIALIGLFLRPNFILLQTLVRISFITAALVLGTLLEITNTYVIFGIVLGISAFVAQIAVTLLVAPKLSGVDKFFLAFAQYNGITAIVLALVLAQWVPKIISIVAIAVIVINSLYYVSNWLLEKKISLRTEQAG